MNGGRLIVATYNIRKALGTDRKRDPERVMRVIADLNADVVCLQEADRRWQPRPPALNKSELLAQTGLRAVQFEHGRESLGWHGNAILVRDGIEVLETDHFDLPGAEPRGGVSAVLSKDKFRIRFIGVHLGLLRWSRKRQLSAIRSFMDIRDDMPTVIAGDFNERSTQRGLGRLAKSFQLLAPTPTYHARRPIVALDRIAVSPQIAGKQVAAFKSPEARLASDHLPLVAQLEIGEGHERESTDRP